MLAAAKDKENQINTLYQAVLSLEDAEECRDFLLDLCTMKELDDMAQRLHVAGLLLEGLTYEQIVKQVDVSTATISRINRSVQYGKGGYAKILGRLKKGG